MIHKIDTAYSRSSCMICASSFAPLDGSCPFRQAGSRGSWGSLYLPTRSCSCIRFSAAANRFALERWSSGR